MDIPWTLGVLAVGAENVLPLTGGAAATRAEAIEAASGALVVAVSDRGRAEYRLTIADTHLIVIPGLTEHGEIELPNWTTGRGGDGRSTSSAGGDSPSSPPKSAASRAAARRQPPVRATGVVGPAL